MKKVGFIGVYDKIDLIIYIAKVITTLDKKVLVIDSTTNQKARYIVPTMNPTAKYITDFEDIDVAVGFSDMDDIKRYLGLSEEQEIDYDIVLIDVDNEAGFKNFELNKIQKNYFVTSFDNYSLKKGLEILEGLSDVMCLTKILFARDILKEDDDYLNFLSLGYKLVWNEYRIYFPIENGDLSVIYENQRVSKIKFKKLSIPYKDGLVYLSTEILGDTSETKVRRVVKLIEKGT